DGAHIGDLRQCRRAVPAVDRKSEGAADAGIVKRLFLVVWCDQTAAVPVALLNRDFVAQCLDEFVARRRREAPELDRRAVGAYRVKPYRLLVGIDRLKAVEIRQPFAIIIGIACTADRLPGLEFGEFEWTGAKDVLLIPARILVEYFFSVNKGEGVG